MSKRCATKSLTWFAKQADIKSSVISDGEYGKAGWIRYVRADSAGFVHRPFRDERQKPNLSVYLIREA